MPPSSPLEAAIEEVANRGWMINGLGRGPANTIAPWSCDVFPGIFGEYVWGEPVKMGYDIAYDGMVRITTDGATPLEAVEKAIAAIDKSPKKRLYERLEKALSRWADVWCKDDDLKL